MANTNKKRIQKGKMKTSTWIGWQLRYLRRLRVGTLEGTLLLCFVMVFFSVLVLQMRSAVDNVADRVGSPKYMAQIYKPALDAKIKNNSTVSKGGKVGIAPNRVLVQFSSSVTSSAKNEILNKNGLKIKKTIKGANVDVLEIPDGVAPESVIAKLKKDNKNEIQFAEVDELLQPSLIPNDPNFPSQWHHTKMRTPSAWDSSNGADVVVAVADTGVDCTHPDLSANCVAGWNVVSNSSVTTDVHGHGTWVAGTIGALANNGLQVAGEAYGAKIMPIRISDTSDGYAYWSDVTDAINYAANNGAKIVTVSYQATGSASVQSAAAYMKSKGGLVTMSAGNTGTLTGAPKVENIITVSATGSGDTRASWSSFGEDVDVAAPGVSILSTSRGGGVASVSGTSFSAPLTAGALALTWAANTSLSNDQVKQTLFDTAVDLGAAGWDQYYGWGRVDVAAAVEKAKAMIGNPDPTPTPTPTPTPAPTPTTPDTEAPVVSFVKPVDGAAVSGGQQVTIQATDNVKVATIEAYFDGKLVTSGAVSPLSFSWNTRKTTNGVHQWRAVATDAAGNVAEKTISVTVQQATKVR